MAATSRPVLFIVRSLRKACEMSSSRPQSGRLMGRRLEGGPTANYGEKCTSEKEGEEKKERKTEGEDEDEDEAAHGSCRRGERVVDLGSHKTPAACLRVDLQADG